ncbi:hypothetical protein C2845_PM04G09040 [Panicum miliaceum]|uniref:Uncharacterized protein n=1 Tax=Panicum miliaceum TaxID=4540 RepID=A0A3L6QMS5_PANMI|nr:hypothetical protein C2845_PM04G09040 [Panicum miliaceum]
MSKELASVEGMPERIQLSAAERKGIKVEAGIPEPLSSIFIPSRGESISVRDQGRRFAVLLFLQQMARVPASSSSIWDRYVWAIVMASYSSLSTRGGAR